MVQKEPTAHPILSSISRSVYHLSPSLQSNVLNLTDSISSSLDKRFTTVDNVPFPNTIDIELTAICNLRCEMCWWWGEKGIAKELANDKGSIIHNMLSTEEVHSIIDKVAPYKPSVYLSGAEVFTRTDIIEILEYLSKKDLKTSLTTNGTLIKDKHIEKISNMRNLRINFSIDGLEDTHNSIRGKGNFQKTSGVIQKLIKARGDNKFPFIGFYQDFLPRNWTCFPFCETQVSIIFQDLIFVKPGVHSDRNPVPVILYLHHFR